MDILSLPNQERSIPKMKLHERFPWVLGRPRDRHWLAEVQDARQGVHEKDAAAQQVGSGRGVVSKTAAEITYKGIEANIAGILPSWLIGRLRKGTASEKSPCILSSSQRLRTQRHPGTHVSQRRSRSSNPRQHCNFTLSLVICSVLMATSPVCASCLPPRCKPPQQGGRARILQHPPCKVRKRKQ